MSSNGASRVLGIAAAAGVIVFVAAFAILTEIRNDNTLGDGPLTMEFVECQNRELDEFVATGRDVDLNCEGEVPAYAERPALYALLGGAAVALVAFVIGWGITSMNRPADER